MVNKIIFLYDASKEQEGTDKDSEKFENIMFTINGGKTKSYIYYLKINTGSSETQAWVDEFYSYDVSASGNNLESRIYANLNLRDEKDLVKCFKKIKSKWYVKSQYFFITTGEGKVIYYDPRFIKLRESLQLSKTNRKELWKNENFNLEFAKELERNEIILSLKNDVWNNEKIWNKELTNALKIVKPSIGIFFNCNTNFVDSIYCYNKCFAYCISTENFLSTSMMDLENLIQLGISSDNYNKAEFAQRVFNSITPLMGSVAHRTPSMDGSTLFLTNLKNFENFIVELNMCIQTLITNYSNDFDWFNRVLEKVSSKIIYSTVIDLKLLLLAISKELNNSDLSTRINILLNRIELNNEFMISRHIQSSLGDNSDMCGITMYIPLFNSTNNTISHVFTPFIKEYIEKYPELQDIFLWYKFLFIVEKNLFDKK